MLMSYPPLEGNLANSQELKNIGEKALWKFLELQFQSSVEFFEILKTQNPEFIVT